MQIRKAMSQAEHRNLLTGIIEMDETYVGGKPRKGTKGDGRDGKHKSGRGTKEGSSGGCRGAWRQSHREGRCQGEDEGPPHAGIRAVPR